MDVVEAMGLSMSDLRVNGNGTYAGHRIDPERESRRWQKKKIAEYVYTDRAGNSLFTKTRYETGDGGKTFRFEPSGRKQAVLYNLHRIRPGRVYLVEGEKDADRLTDLELIATTPGGASDWKPAMAESLVGCDVVLLPDNDEPGKKMMAAVAKNLRAKDVPVRTVELPVEEKGDVSDWLDAGGTAEELGKLADAAGPMAGVLDKRGVALLIHKHKTLDVAATGLFLVDDALGGGFYDSQVGVLTAPTGNGKTALALQMARRQSRSRPVFFHTMEMPPEFLALRCAGQESGDSYRDIRKDDEKLEKNIELIPDNVYWYAGKDFDRVADAMKYLCKISDRRPILFVDYIQKAATGDEIRAAVTEVSEGIRKLASDLVVPTLAISAASRGGAQRLRYSRGKNPEDFQDVGRESGAIEYDASFLLATGLEDLETADGSRPAVMNVAKSRMGSPRQIEFAFHGASGVWTELGLIRRDEGQSRKEAVTEEDYVNRIVELLSDGVVRSKNRIAKEVKGKKARVLGAVDLAMKQGRIAATAKGHTCL